MVESIQEHIIAEIIKLNNNLGRKLLDAEVVKEVLLAQNAQEHLFVYLKDVIYCIINGTDLLHLTQ